MKYLKITFTSIFLFSTLFFVNCKDGKKDAEVEIENTSIAETFCFKNEYKFEDNQEMIDVLELKLEINDDKVTGNYNWLPALKDQRNGTLEGTIKENVINAVYNYQQEGANASAPITITLFEDKASLKSDDPNLGLDTEVAKIACNQN